MTRKPYHSRTVGALVLLSLAWNTAQVVADIGVNMTFTDPGDDTFEYAASVNNNSTLDVCIVSFTDASAHDLLTAAMLQSLTAKNTLESPETARAVTKPKGRLFATSSTGKAKAIAMSNTTKTMPDTTTAP